VVLVKFHTEDRIAVVTLNRPDRLNAISSDFIDAFLNALAQAEACDSDVILLEAEGRAFCAGDDLEELASGTPTADYVTDFVNRLQDISRKLMFGTKPVVCAVQGYVVGGGAAWALNADFSIAADDCKMFCPEAGFGMFVSGGVSVLLADCCGSVRANEIIWRAQRVGVSELLAFGIIGNVVPRAELASAARALASEIATLPTASRRRMKVLRAALLRDKIEAAIAIESRFCIEAGLDPSLRQHVKKVRG
jgi:enoyl-CoA hydratase/carnithine racemase